MAEQNQTKPKFRTSIGGQALIEGILMRGPEKQAIVVRSKEGLVEKVEELKLIRDRYPILGLPVLRGAVAAPTSVTIGSVSESYTANTAAAIDATPKAQAAEYYRILCLYADVYRGCS